MGVVVAPLGVLRASPCRAFFGTALDTVGAALGAASVSPAGQAPRFAALRRVLRTRPAVGRTGPNAPLAAFVPSTRARTRRTRRTRVRPETPSKTNSAAPFGRLTFLSRFHPEWILVFPGRELFLPVLLLLSVAGFPKTFFFYYFQISSLFFKVFFIFTK